MGKHLVWAVGAVALAGGLGACGSSGGGSTAAGSGASTHQPAAAPAPPAAGAPAPPGTAPTTTPATTPADSASLPTYQPSTVVSQAPGHTQLTSPDPVATVTSFYKSALSQGDWSVTSSNQTAASANFVAKKSSQGTTVAISSAGPAGTSISVSTYPA